MQHTEGHLSGYGETDLFYQTWKPQGPPRGVVVLVHGVSEHSGRYKNLVAPLANAGYAVYGYDQRGHGRSAGLRVHIDSWVEYREDLRMFMKLVSGLQPGVPLFVYGHSMGSLVVLDYLIDDSSGIAGAIVSGTAIEPVGVASPFMIKVARTLTGVLPRMSIALTIAPESLTRDPQALEERCTDPLVSDHATVRWGTESLDAVERIKAGMSTIDVPMLVVHGGDDPLNDVSGAKALFDALPGEDKTLKVYPGVRHEPHNDIGHAKVAADIVQWLDRLTAKAPAAS